MHTELTAVPDFTLQHHLRRPGDWNRSVPQMNPHPVRFDLLFDADEHHRSGMCPWTFFAYPTSLAVERGLPPDNDACELLGHVQDHEIDVAIWVNGIVENTTYFACRKEDIHRLHDVLQELEDTGMIEPNFCSRRSERLFAKLAGGTDQSAGHIAAEGSSRSR